MTVQHCSSAVLSPLATPVSVEQVAVAAVTGYGAVSVVAAYPDLDPVDLGSADLDQVDLGSADLDQVDPESTVVLGLVDLESAVLDQVDPESAVVLDLVDLGAAVVLDLIDLGSAVLDPVDLESAVVLGLVDPESAVLDLQTVGLSFVGRSTFESADPRSFVPAVVRFVKPALVARVPVADPVEE